MRWLAIVCAALLLASGVSGAGQDCDEDLVPQTVVGGQIIYYDPCLAEPPAPDPRSLELPERNPCRFGPVTMRVDGREAGRIGTSAPTRREGWQRILQMPQDPSLEPITFALDAPDDGRGEGLDCSGRRPLPCNFGPIRKRVDYRDVEDILVTSETRREAWERIQVMTEQGHLQPLCFVVNAEDDGLGDGLACKQPPRRP